MPSYGVGVTIEYYAFDTTNNIGKTGDAANHTLRWVKDGVEDTTTIPTATEIDSTNCPGLYKATITATQTQCQVGTLHGKSSTSGIVIVPTQVGFENLPTASPGGANGIPTLDGSSHLIVYSVTSSVGSVTSAVTVGTNNDKSGYSLVSTEHTLISADVLNATASSYNTAGSIGAKINAAGSSTDPLTNAASTYGTAGTIGHYLAQSLSNTGATVATNNDKTGYSVLLSQAVPLTGNTGNTVGDCLNAARAAGFGAMAISGNSLILYGSDGATVVRTFTLDSSSAPTQRS